MTQNSAVMRSRRPPPCAPAGAPCALGPRQSGVRRNPLISILLLLLCFPAHAEDLYLVATVASYHFDRNAGYNEKNNGLGIEVHHNPDFRSGFGFYKNSYYRDTVYLFATFVPAQIGDVRFGGSVGIVTGYLKHPAWVLIPTASYEYDRFGFNIGFTPSFLGFQVKYLIE